MVHSILVVDDNDAIRRSMHKFLEISKYNVSSVTSAEEAIKFLINNQVDVIITDIMMDGMSGLELTEVINASEPSKKRRPKRVN